MFSRTKISHFLLRLRGWSGYIHTIVQWYLYKGALLPRRLADGAVQIDPVALLIQQTEGCHYSSCVQPAHKPISRGSILYSKRIHRRLPHLVLTYRVLLSVKPLSILLLASNKYVLSASGCRPCGLFTRETNIEMVVDRSPDLLDHLPYHCRCPRHG